MHNRLSVQELFAEASKLPYSKKGKKTEAEWEETRAAETALRLKRAAMGFWRSTAVVTLDEIASLLQSTGLVANTQQGRELAPALVGKDISYSKYFSRHLVFGKKGINGIDHYQLTVEGTDV